MIMTKVKEQCEKKQSGGQLYSFRSRSSNIKSIMAMRLKYTASKISLYYFYGIYELKNSNSN